MLNSARFDCCCCFRCFYFQLVLNIFYAFNIYLLHTNKIELFLVYFVVVGSRFVWICFSTLYRIFENSRGVECKSYFNKQLSLLCTFTRAWLPFLHISGWFYGYILAQPFVRNKIRIAFGNFSMKKYIFSILNITFIGNPEKQFQIQIFHLLWKLEHDDDKPKAIYSIGPPCWNAFRVFRLQEYFVHSNVLRLRRGVCCESLCLSGLPLKASPLSFWQLNMSPTVSLIFAVIKLSIRFGPLCRSTLPPVKTDPRAQTSSADILIIDYGCWWGGG